MKKATKIVLLIAGILAIVAAVGYLAASIFYFVAGGLMIALDQGAIQPADFPQWASDLIEKLIANYHYEDLAALATALFVGGALFLVAAIFCIPAAVLSFVARGKDKQGLYIACIVLGVLSGTFVALVGGILGLIHLGVDKPQEEPKAVEEKPAEAKPAEPKAE